MHKLKKDIHTVNSDHVFDKELKKMFQAQLPVAPENQWFIRKVMNRLPDKMQKSSMSWAEKTCYIIAAAVLLGGWISALVHTCLYGLSSAVILAAALIPAIALFCVAVIAAPAILKAIRSI